LQKKSRNAIFNAHIKSANPRTSALDKKIDGAYMSINENITEESWDQVSDFEARFLKIKDLTPCYSAPNRLQPIRYTVPGIVRRYAA
jgi:hypothetical protein